MGMITPVQDRIPKVDTLIDRIQNDVPAGMGPMALSSDGHIIYHNSGKVQDMSTDPGYDSKWKDLNKPLPVYIRRWTEIPTSGRASKTLPESGLYYIAWFGNSNCSRQLRLSVSSDDHSYTYSGAITQRHDPPMWYSVMELGTYTLADRLKWEKAAMNVKIRKDMTSRNWVEAVIDQAVEMGLALGKPQGQLLDELMAEEKWRVDTISYI